MEWGSKKSINLRVDLFINNLYNVKKKGGYGLDKTIIIRADDETLDALEKVKASESQIRLTNITSSECIRYLIKKEAAALDALNKKT